MQDTVKVNKFITSYANNNSYVFFYFAIWKKWQTLHFIQLIAIIQKKCDLKYSQNKYIILPMINYKDIEFYLLIYECQKPFSYLLYLQNVDYVNCSIFVTHRYKKLFSNILRSTDVPDIFGKQLQIAIIFIRIVHSPYCLCYPGCTNRSRCTCQCLHPHFPNSPGRNSEKALTETCVS